MNSSVQICLQLGNSQKLFDHFQKQPPEVFYKESHSQTFCDINRKTPVQGSCFNKVTDHVTLLKRDSNTYFLVTISEIYKNYFEEYQQTATLLKVFCENVLTSDLNFAKGLADLMTCCVKGCSNQSRLNKNASYNKVLHEEIKYLKRRLKTIATGKSFMKNLIKNRKYFSAQQYQNFRKF